MASQIKVNVEGLEPLLRRLKRIENPRRRRSILRSSMRAGMTPMAQELRKGITGSGAIRKRWLRKAVKAVLRVYRSGVVAMIIGVRDRKFPDGENPGKYWHLVDLGVQPHPQQRGPVMLDGQWFQVGKRESYYQHPGHRGRGIKVRAANRAWPRIVPKIFNRLEKLIGKELAYGQRG